MKIFVWRHNKTYHSHSMIEEPCIQNEFYLDALAIVMANDIEEALELLAARNDGWRVDDLRNLSPKIYDMDQADIIFTHVHGSIAEQEVKHGKNN